MDVFEGIPENAAQAATAPLQAVAELDPLPRFARRYSAVMDHAPFKPSSKPPPAAHPTLEKSLPPLNEAAGFVAPAGVYESVLSRDPGATIAPTRK